MSVRVDGESEGIRDKRDLFGSDRGEASAQGRSLPSFFTANTDHVRDFVLALVPAARRLVHSGAQRVGCYEPPGKRGPRLGSWRWQRDARSCSGLV